MSLAGVVTRVKQPAGGFREPAQQIGRADLLRMRVRHGADRQPERSEPRIAPHPYHDDQTRRSQYEISKDLAITLRRVLLVGHRLQPGGRGVHIDSDVGPVLSGTAPCQ